MNKIERNTEKFERNFVQNNIKSKSNTRLVFIWVRLEKKAPLFASERFFLLLYFDEKHVLRTQICIVCMYCMY